MLILIIPKNDAILSTEKMLKYKFNSLLQWIPHVQLVDLSPSGMKCGENRMNTINKFSFARGGQR